MTQSVNHHPSISLLELYCDGSLNAEVALLVATHLDYCPHCQQLRHDIETDLGAQLASSTPASQDLHSADWLEMLNSIVATPQLPRTAAAPAQSAEQLIQIGSYQFELPRSLRRVASKRSKWLSMGGIATARLPSGEPHHASLLFIDKHTDVPLHTHQGLEMTLVLAGEMVDHRRGAALQHLGSQEVSRGELGVGQNVVQGLGVVDHEQLFAGFDVAARLTGNAGANTLDGGTGLDTLIGGDGNDVYLVDDANDVLTETSTGGTDLVNSSVSFILGANLENLNLTDPDQWANVSIEGITLSERGAAAELAHEEYRDDRYVAALKLYAGQPAQLFYLVRAVTPGTYVVPPPQVEDMYRAELRGVGRAVPATVTVVQP
mgnify:CR=1 FL=1